MKVQAPIKVDRKTKRLAKRLTGREIAVINHVDIDEVAANSLVEGKIKLVINASESISGRYPNKGPGILTENNILIIDNVGEELFHNLAEGQIIEVIDGNIYRDGELLLLAETQPDADAQFLCGHRPEGNHFGGVRKNAPKGRTQVGERRKAHEG